STTENAMTHSFDIAIVGGGLAGQSLAAALRHLDFSVALIEGRSLAKTDDRVTSLNRSSITLYERIGVGAALLKAAQPMFDIKVVDDATGAAMSFEEGSVPDAPGDGQEDTPVAAHGYVVHNQDILAALAQSRQGDEGLVVFENTSAHIEEIAPSHAVLALADGTKLKAGLVCAADGGRSAFRAAAGISSLSRTYKQANITATLTHAHGHGGIGFQRFLPGGPVAFIPMQGTQSSLAWTVPESAAGSILGLSDEAFLALLSAQIFGADEADTRGPLTATGPRSTYPIRANIADTFHAARLLLVGDAAHVIHPLAGQGFNLTVRDIGVVAQLLQETRALGGDIGGEALCAAYSARRRPDILATFAATDALNRAYSTRNPAWTLLRNAAMRLGKRQAMLRQLFSAQAQGSVFGLPPLMAPEG
ncbi:MAG: FAD-dependent monooxygenase, partial [Pseudomonadota bacterium]